MPAIRIAVAGAGAIGRRHIEETLQCPGVALSAIVDPSPAAAELAQRCGVAHFDSLAALFAAEPPHGVVLATPNAMHVAQGLQCIEAGIPVLVEKPLAHTLADGERLVAQAERSGHKLLVGHHRRHSAILHAVVELMRSGVLGRLVGVLGSALFYKPADYYDPPNDWRRRSGGGPILLNMIHEVDNLRAMVGEIVAVQAFASNATRGFEVEDTVAVNLRFANGALGSFMLCDTAASPKSWEQTSHENLAYAHSPEDDAYTLVGTMGSLAVPTMRLKTYPRPQERSWFKPFDERTLPLERVDPLARQIAHFAAVIRGEAQPLVTGRDGLQNLRVVEAIAEAARSSRLVELAPR